MSSAINAEPSTNTGKNFYARAWENHPAKMGLIHGALIGGAAVCAFYNREAIKDVALSSLDSTVKFLAPKVNSALVSGQRGLKIAQVHVKSAVNVSKPYIASAGNLVKIHAQAISGYAHDGAKGIVNGVISTNEVLGRGLSYGMSKAGEIATFAGSKIVENAAIAKASAVSALAKLNEQTPIVTETALNITKDYVTAAKPYVKPVSAGLAGIAAIGTACKKVYNFVNNTKAQLESMQKEIESLRAQIVPQGNSIETSLG